MWLFWRSEEPQRLFPYSEHFVFPAAICTHITSLLVHSTGLADFIKKVPESHGC